MKYYKSLTEFNCGVDLHGQQMYICVVDREGKILVHCNIKGNDLEYFWKKVEPWKHSLTVCCECIFNWYFLADACQVKGIPFVLAHALYLKLIHGGKNKNDRVDSEKLAHLLRANLIPPSYVYPAEKRPVRGLLRQRMTYVWRRAELMMRVQINQIAEGREPVAKGGKNRDVWEGRLKELARHPLHQITAEVDLHMIRQYDLMILRLERELLRITKRDSWKEFNLLQTIPGIGRSLALTILYEMDRAERFPTVKNFLSYARLVKGSVASAGKIKGLRGGKLGNPYLRWAFGEAAVIAKRSHEMIKQYAQKLEQRHGKFKANSVLAAKLGRAVYFMLRNGTGFDLEKLVATSA